jgi:acetylglutamate kinase
VDAGIKQLTAIARVKLLFCLAVSYHLVALYSYPFPLMPTFTPPPSSPLVRLLVVKIGGNVIDSPAVLSSFLQAFAALPHPKVLVHGGGKLATDLSAQLGLETTMIDGRRVTDAETLKLVTMVYGGLINKSLVSSLQACGCNALGLTGADAGFVLAHRRPPANGVDYGFVGDIRFVNASVLHTFVESGMIPVCAPLTHDGAGNMLNTNADTIASECARALVSAYPAHYAVELVYCFEKKGVLRDVHDEATVIPSLSAVEYQTLKATGAIAKGMIPKLDNAFAALRSGVCSVAICHADDIHTLSSTTPAGTRLTA